jgi:hypothetical protein
VDPSDVAVETGLASHDLQAEVGDVKELTEGDGHRSTNCTNVHA